jgi:hypothetical protein
MPVIAPEGKYTIKDVLHLTFNNQYKNRYEYMKRDKIKTIYIREIKTFNPKNLNEPSYSFEFISTSLPQYSPYFTKKVVRQYRKGKKEYTRKTQRTIKHHYSIYLRVWGNGSINTKRWKVRLGEDRMWRTKNKISPRLLKSKKYPNAPYLNVGDYNSRYYGLNGDWIFRAAYYFREAGHSYNVRHTGYKKPTISDQIFFPKHLINLFNVLLQSKLLLDIPPTV